MKRCSGYRFALWDPNRGFVHSYLRGIERATRLSASNRAQSADVPTSFETQTTLVPLRLGSKGERRGNCSKNIGPVLQPVGYNPVMSQLRNAPVRGQFLL